VSKIEAFNELNNKNSQLINDYKAKNANLQQIQETLNEAIAMQRTAIDEYKQFRENLLKKIEELKLEITLNKNKIELLEQANNKFIFENEELKSKLKEKQEFINQKLERAKNLSKQDVSDKEINEEDIEYIKLDWKKLRRMIMCSVCNNHERQVILTKCYHSFCKKCIDKNLEVRARKCPSCRTKFGADDVKPLFWD